MFVKRGSFPTSTAVVVDIFTAVLWCISRLLIAVGGIVGIVVCRFAGAIGGVLQARCELFEQESAFEAHLHDCSVQAGFALTSGIVGFFDVVEAALELDALSVVGLFYRGREWCVLGCFCGGDGQWIVGCLVYLRGVPGGAIVSVLMCTV